MRIALYSENLLQNSGGAEVYALLLAQALREKYEVSLFSIGNPKVGFSDVFKKYNVNELPLYIINEHRPKSVLKSIICNYRIRRKLQRKIKNNYNLFINCSCNKMVGLKNVKSIHLIHFPAKNYNHKLPKPISTFLNNQYKHSYAAFIVNSNFTNHYLNEYWGITGRLLYPPINMEPINDSDLSKKENIILIVGRLVPEKKIIELINAFKLLSKNDYKLVIIGNKDTNNIDYYEKIISVSNGFNITVLNDTKYSELVSYYKKAKIFWHGCGYLAKNEDPFFMEHFGMTTVEAMANGCIPVVINKAGQKEIIQNAHVGYLWNTIEELIDFTNNIIGSENLLSLQKKIVNSSRGYLLDSFNQKALEIINHYVE